MEGRQIKTATIDDFLAKKKLSLKRYSSSFKLLWDILVRGGVPPQSATEDQVADAIIQIFTASPAQARNAYSAVLLIPGYGNLRFHPLLRPYKKSWNTNLEKYGAFWDPTEVLLALQQTPLCSLTEQDLRTHFIISSRLLCLYRSSDLANLKRSVSVLNGKTPFIKIRRKGQKMPKWERIVSIPQTADKFPLFIC